jgi:iron-sulfur cluster assembly protein
MISLTPSATTQLNIACSSNQTFVRLALRAGGCAGYSYDWSLDTPNQSDYIVPIGEYGLIMDYDSMLLLGDVSLNFVVDMFGTSWEIISNNATSSCGCGKSVSVGSGCNG